MTNPQAVWSRFFEACELPVRVQKQYADSFVSQRIQPYMLNELGKDELRQLGVETLGDQIAILRYIKKSDGANASVFTQKAPTANRELVSTSTLKNSEPEPQRVLKAKATSSSSSSTLQPRSVVIRKQPNQPTIKRVSGLRSDEIIQQRARRNQGIEEERFSPVYPPPRSTSRITVRNVPAHRLDPVRAPPPYRRSSISTAIRERVTYSRRPQPQFFQRQQRYLD